MGTRQHQIIVALLATSALYLSVLLGGATAQVNFGGQTAPRPSNPTNQQNRRPTRRTSRNFSFLNGVVARSAFKLEFNFPDITNKYGSFSHFYQSLPQPQDNNITLRNFEEEIRACDVRKSEVFPRKAKNLKGEFMFVLNSMDFTQVIEIETCLGEGLPCLLDEDAPSQDSTSCRQQYASYQLLALNENGTIVVDSFQLPSACTCHHRDILGFDGLNRRIINNKQTINNKPPICDPTGFHTRIINRGPQNQVQLCKKSRPKRRGKSDNTVVFFPGTSNRGCQLLQPKECANNKVICDDNSDYPEDVVRQRIQRVSTKIRDLYLKPSCLAVTNVINTRNGFNEGIQLCQGITRIMAPTKARNLNGIWKYIVNIEGYTQTIDTEECSIGFGFEGESSHCTYSGTDGQDTTQTNCKQVYRKHKLLAMNVFGEYEEDDFNIPSACACYYRRNYNPSLLLRTKN